MSTALLATAVITAVVLSGCSSSNKFAGTPVVPAGGGASSSATTTGPASAGPTSAGPTSAGPTSAGATSAGSESTGPLSEMSMRVVNLFAPKKAAGPALDIYDVQLTGQKATPIAANVAYGSASPYFTPHAEDSSVRVQLYALPAGEDPVAHQSDAQSMGGADDDGSHPQITWVLTADTGSVMGNGPLAGLSFRSEVEKGTDNGAKAPVAPPPPAGHGEIMVDTAAVAGLNDDLYLMVDRSCAPALNGNTDHGTVPFIAAVDGKAPVSSFALFATAPGSHQVSVVAWTDTTPPTCVKLTAKQGTTTVDIADGAQVETYVYGTSVTDLHLALAPIHQ